MNSQQGPNYTADQVLSMLDRLTCEIDFYRSCDESDHPFIDGKVQGLTEARIVLVSSFPGIAKEVVARDK